MCAKDSLDGPAVIAYADTLIRADFDLDTTADSVIWVKQVDQPEAFGVVNLNANGEIIELVEKPKEFVSDLAVNRNLLFQRYCRVEKRIAIGFRQQYYPWWRIPN